MTMIWNIGLPVYRAGSGWFKGLSVGKNTNLEQEEKSFLFKNTMFTAQEVFFSLCNPKKDKRDKNLSSYRNILG